MNNNPVQQKADSIDYDYGNDSLFLYTKGMGYKQSLNLDNIIVDFDDKYQIKGVEILGASEKFGVSKFELRKPEEIKIHLKISENVVELSVNLTLERRNRHVPKVISVTGLNESNIPSGTMAMSC
ncbi:DUF2283 domain-containing protein [Methanoplanus endosymbiosus]|uniref:DUF2283 domain-containing protein n=1 Tax=Methanoplanus endosymbiosus TaxID=33865 RepID=A0A9E7PKL0_9EURY|nr:DUF2283 domain-containing protein [Methanoplanus endosymbiosus]UUX91788.1 DUF2283 domain-containing protein [Methanoplanus endosymbiosus]